MYFRFNDNTVDNYGTVAKELSQHTPQERKNKLKFKNEDGNNEFVTKYKDEMVEYDEEEYQRRFEAVAKICKKYKGKIQHVIANDVLNVDATQGNPTSTQYMKRVKKLFKMIKKELNISYSNIIIKSMPYKYCNIDIENTGLILNNNDPSPSAWTMYLSLVIPKLTPKTLAEAQPYVSGTRFEIKPEKHIDLINIDDNTIQPCLKYMSPEKDMLVVGSISKTHDINKYVVDLTDVFNKYTNFDNMVSDLKKYIITPIHEILEKSKTKILKIQMIPYKNYDENDDDYDVNNEHNTYEVLCLLKEYIEKDKRFHKYSITKFNISKECFDIRISRYIECRTYTFYKSSGYTYDNSRDILDITHYETCWE